MKKSNLLIASAVLAACSAGTAVANADLDQIFTSQAQPGQVASLTSQEMETTKGARRSTTAHTVDATGAHTDTAKHAKGVHTVDANGVHTDALHKATTAHTVDATGAHTDAGKHANSIHTVDANGVHTDALHTSGTHNSGHH